VVNNLKCKNSGFRGISATEAICAVALLERVSMFSYMFLKKMAFHCNMLFVGKVLRNEMFQEKVMWIKLSNSIVDIVHLIQNLYVLLHHRQTTCRKHSAVISYSY
jgi:hypothetical protein